MKDMISKQHVHVLMLVIAMALAGSSVVVGKFVVSAVPVFLCAFLSLVFAFITILPLMWKRGDEVRNLTKNEWKYLFLQGLCGIVLFRIFTLFGVQSTGAVQAGIITGTTPAVLAVLSFFLLREKLSRNSLLCILLALSGCIIINIFNTDGNTPNTFIGCLLVLAAVVCESLFTIYRKRIASTVSAVTNTAILIFCSLLLLLIPALTDILRFDITISIPALLAILYYGAFATIIAYLLWTYAVAKVSGSVAGVTTAAMPASSVLLAALFLGEKLYWQHILGCVLIVAAIALSSLNYNRINKAINGTKRRQRTTGKPLNATGR